MVAFRYGFDGTRTHKDVTIGGVTATTSYTYNGRLLAHYTCGTCSQHFYHDARGRPAMVKFTNGGMTTYYTYVHNLQGDVVGLVDSANALVVEYKYDAWGKPFEPTDTLVTTHGAENPFRYRRYMYDEETGYYYLRSRYSDPGLRRLVCADGHHSTNFNLLDRDLLYYCRNKPLLFIDYNGYEAAACDIIRVIAVAEPTPFGRILAAIATVAVWAYNNIHSDAREKIKPKRKT